MYQDFRLFSLLGSVDINSFYPWGHDKKIKKKGRSSLCEKAFFSAIQLIFIKFYYKIMMIVTLFKLGVKKKKVELVYGQYGDLAFNVHVFGILTVSVQFLTYSLSDISYLFIIWLKPM